MAIENGRESLLGATLCNLGDGLILRTAGTLADVERIAALGAQVHSDDQVAAYARWKLADGHPAIRLSDALFVEDLRTGKVVSSLCSFPQTWCYEGIRLSVREIALVGTDPGYRKRGLIRAQMHRVHHEMGAAGCLLGCIEGIPGFYRQFGYEFAVPLGSCAKLKLAQLPADEKDSSGSMTVRPMDLERDLATVMLLHRQSELEIQAERSEALWRYLEEAPAGVPDRQETWVIESSARVIAYFRLRQNMWGPWLELAEMCVESSLGLDDRTVAYEAMLRSARRIAVERDYQGLCFALDPRHELLKLVTEMHAEPERQYAWQVKVTDAVELLKRIVPVLEKRLADSAYRSSNATLDINLLPDVARISIEEGRLTGVSWLPGPIKSECELRLSGHQFAQLVLGYRDYAALMDLSLEAWVHPQVRELVGVLFPRLRALVNGAN